MTSLIAILLHWLISGFLLMVASMVVPGFRIKNYSSALIAALVIGVLNWFIRPFLDFISMPINYLTLGLFSFVITAVVLKIAAALLRNFEIESWFAAILGAVVLAVANSVLFYVLAMVLGGLQKSVAHF